jgi:GAF domain-containing protein
VLLVAALWAAVIGADIATQGDVVMVGVSVGAPLLAGLILPRRIVVGFGGLAIAGAAVSFLWDHNAGRWTYWVPLVVVAIGSVFAVLTADARSRLRREAKRLAVLAELGRIAHADRPVEETAQAIAAALVPRAFDLCVIDLLGEDGRPRPLAGAIDSDQQALAALMARPREASEAVGPARRTLEPGETVRLARVDEELRRQFAHDEQDLELLNRLDVSSAVIVPLVGRGRTFGLLRLARRGASAPIDDGWADFAGTAAGRVALAIGNAMLSTELAATERQLQTILATVAGAIIVRAVDGQLVYANQAAADLLRLPGPEAIAAAAPGGLMELFDVYSEEGDPLTLADLPGAKVLAGELAPEPIIVRNVVKATGEERWLMDKASPVLDERGEVAMAVNLIEDVTETKRAELGERLLAQAARQAAEAPDLRTMLQGIAEAAVPGLADWAGVDLLEEGGTIQTVAVAHRDPAKVALGWHLRTAWPVDAREADGLAAVIRTGEPQLTGEITDEMLQAGARGEEHLAILRQVGLHSTMIVPLSAPGEVLGALSFVSSTSRRFSARDLELALDLGRQAGVIVRDLRLNAERAQIAHTLQRGLLPPALPALPGWRVSCAYRAAGKLNEVGGDFYDLVLSPGGWTAIVGDVVGKGAEAAAVTALVRHTLAATLLATSDPKHALRIANQRLREHPSALMLCTVAIVAGGAGAGLSIYSAGHPLPLVRRGEAVQETGSPGPMLGLLDDVEIDATALAAQPGDLLLLYSDGVTDARRDTERFGRERLHDALRAVAPEDDRTPARQLEAVLDGFIDGEPADDMAMLALAREGYAPAFARAGGARSLSSQPLGG